MKLAGRFAPGMTLWYREDVSRWVPVVVERVGITKLTVVWDGVLIDCGPTFVAPRNPKLAGADSPRVRP